MRPPTNRGGRRCGILRMRPRARQTEAHVPSGPASSPAAREREDELIRLALAPDGRSRRTSAPGPRDAARGSASPAPSSMQPTPRASSRRRSSARSRPTRSRSPPISASGSSRRSAKPRSTGSAWKPAPATSSTAADRIETAARAGQGPPAHPCRRRGRGREPQARPGLAGRRRRAAGDDIPRGAHYLVHGTGPRKCGTCRPDRSRCRFACPTRACPVAGFHWPRSWSGRRRTRLEDRLG